MQLRPASDSVTEATITLSYLTPGIEEGRDLSEWARTYHAIGPAAYEDLGFFPFDLAHANLPEGSQQIYVASKEGVPHPFHAYYITHGKLVFSVSMQATVTEERAVLLRQMAESITFSKDAPLNTAQLASVSGMSPEPDTTLRSVEERLEELESVAEALSIRLQTGETPGDLLDRMSDWGRDMYERQVLVDAGTMEMYDQIRTMPPAPTRTPDQQAENDKSYRENEEQYNQWLQDTGQLGEDVEPQSAPPSSWLQDAMQPRQSGACLTQPPQAINNRRGLVARYTTPIRTYERNVKCGSDWHINKETYAIDIQVDSGTLVYAMTQNETVLQSQWATGWGNYVWTTSLQAAEGGYKAYHTVYAHLTSDIVSQGDVLSPTNLIGYSGNTGGDFPPHLHLAMFTSNHDPVDLTPVKGFTPNLLYPWQCEDDGLRYCGKIADPVTEPIIIEANEATIHFYTYAEGLYWHPSAYLPNHTTQYYRALTHVGGGYAQGWSHDPITSANKHLSPQLRYEIWIPTTSAIWRIWLCGMGGSIEDDSVHMGSDNEPRSTADRVTGYHSTNWIWASTTADNGSMPYLNLSTGYHTIDLWGREDGMRVDRILLTKSGYTPTATIRCGANSLYD